MVSDTFSFPQDLFRTTGVDMKSTVTGVAAVLLILLGVSIKAESAPIACSETEGNLQLDTVYQPPGFPWCWVASAKMVMNYRKINEVDQQCFFYDVAYRDDLTEKSIGDCCFYDQTNAPNACLRTGWHANVFDKFRIPYKTIRGPLSWDQVTEEICSKDRPFISVVQFVGGGKHTLVVKGYKVIPDGNIVVVDDHVHGIRDLSYDCQYATSCAGHWTHYGDYISIDIPPSP
jgi:hypothetical protein